VTLYRGQPGGGAPVQDWTTTRTWGLASHQVPPSGVRHWGFQSPSGAEVRELDWSALPVAVVGAQPAQDAAVVQVGDQAVRIARDAQGRALLAVDSDEGLHVLAWLLLAPMAIYAALLDDVQPDPAAVELGLRVPNARRRYLVRRQGDLPVPTSSLNRPATAVAWLWDDGLGRLSRVDRIMAAPEYDERRYAYIEAGPTN